MLNTQTKYRVFLGTAADLTRAEPNAKILYPAVPSSMPTQTFQAVTAWITNTLSVVHEAFIEVPCYEVLRNGAPGLTLTCPRNASKPETYWIPETEVRERFAKQTDRNVLLGELSQAQTRVNAFTKAEAKRERDLLRELGDMEQVSRAGFTKAYRTAEARLRRYEEAVRDCQGTYVSALLQFSKLTADMNSALARLDTTTPGELELRLIETVASGQNVPNQLYHSITILLCQEDRVAKARKTLEDQAKRIKALKAKYHLVELPPDFCVDPSCKKERGVKKSRTNQ